MVLGPSQIALIAFASIFMVAVAGGLLIRDLITVRGGTGTLTGRRLRRRLVVFDQAPARDFWGRMDQGFERLILESGVDVSPWSGFLLLLVSALLFGGGAWLYTDDPLLGIAGGVGGMLVPLAAFAAWRFRRIARIRDELPHVLEMLARATRAGQSIEQALDFVAHEAPPLLSREFRDVVTQLEMGRAFDKVMKSLSRRLPLVEFRILATTLIVQRQTGGRLSETLERMAGVVRDRLTAQRQMRASTGAGRMSTLTVAAVGPIAFVAIYLLHREHLQVLFTDPTGRIALWFALALEVIGLGWVFMLLKEND